MIAKPAIYLDTNICRDIMQNRASGTKSHILFNDIREKNWDCYTGIFTFMEITDVQQDDLFVSKKIREGWEYNQICKGRYTKELSDEELTQPLTKLNIFLIQNKFVKPVILTEEGWKLAFYIASRSTLSSPDSIHLAGAWQSDCHLLVTNDQDFLKQANSLLQKEKVSSKLKVCQPEKVIEALKGMK